jgi:hypothetical protein
MLYSSVVTTWSIFASVFQGFAGQPVNLNWKDKKNRKVEKYAIFVSGKLYKQAKEHVRESGDKFKKGFPRSKNASDNSSEGPK